MIGVYKITSPSGKVYIGSSIDIERRKGEYKNHRVHKQPRLFYSFNKYGFINHIFEVVCECTAYELLSLEYFYGTKFGVLGKKGLNCRLPKMDDISVCMSDETKLKIGAANKGNKRPDLSMLNKRKAGLTLPEKTKLAMSIAQIGRTHPQSVKDKIKIAHLGKTKSVEHRKNLSISKSLSGKKVMNKITGEVFINMKTASISINKNPAYLGHRFKAGYHTDFALIQ